MDRIRLEQGLADLEFGIKKKVKRTKSKFNSAVSKGMKAVKNSVSYGKKGRYKRSKESIQSSSRHSSQIKQS